MRSQVKSVSESVVQQCRMSCTVATAAAALVPQPATAAKRHATIDSAPHGGKKPPLNVLSLTLVNRAFRSAMYCISFCGRDRTCLYSTDTHYIIRGDRSRSIDRSWVAKKQPWKLTVLFLYSNTEILQELSDRREWLNLLCSIIQINNNYCNKLRIVLWVLCMGMIKK